MFHSNSPLYCSVWRLLALLPCWSAAQLTVPAAVEIDLIFPRNGTYSPTAYMPIVFAIQNSRYAASLDLTFRYTLRNGTGPQTEFTRLMDLEYADFSSRDPYFAIDSVPYMNTEGTWTFNWLSFSGHCAQTVVNVTSEQNVLGDGFQQNQTFLGFATIEFSIKNGAKAPDLIAATADDTCASSENFTFSVTKILDVPKSDIWDGRKSCAVLPTPYSRPSANPCGAKLNSSVASSISAAITSCAINRPGVTTGCVPLTTSDAFVSGKQLSFRGMVFLISVWLIYLV
jgi:hypothetical protein